MVMGEAEKFLLLPPPPPPTESARLTAIPENFCYYPPPPHRIWSASGDHGKLAPPKKNPGYAVDYTLHSTGNSHSTRVGDALKGNLHACLPVVISLMDSGRRHKIWSSCLTSQHFYKVRTRSTTQASSERWKHQQYIFSINDSPINSGWLIRTTNVIDNSPLFII